MSLHVGLLNDSFPPAIDGVANAVLNYAGIIQRKYGEATVITPRYPHIVDNYPFEVYRYPSICFSGSAMPYRVGNPFLPTAVMELNSKNMDLLHVHSPFASSVMARELVLGKKNRKPTVLTYHTKFNIDIDKWVNNPGFNKIAKSFVLNNINSADEVWAVSNGTVDNLREIGYEGEVIIMPNGIDFSLGKAPKEDIEEIKRMYLIDDNEFIMLFVGRINWYKNLEIILDSLKSLLDNGYKFKMLFVGEGPDRFAVEHYAKTLGIYDRLIFTGAIYDRAKVKAFFSLANLFLFPSTFDTSGLVVKEAAACGCPSILTRGSCAAEDVEDGVSGLLAEENATDFAAKVALFMDNPQLQTELSENAPKYLYTTWEESVDRAVRRYEIVIENFKRKNG